MKQRINRHGAARPTPNVTVSVRIDKVVAEGDGFGHLEDGRVIFVEGGLPGELVLARIVKQSKDYARATAVEILEPSAQRVVPPCEYVAQGCGGCDLQHASIDLQRQIKLDIVRESLTRLGKITAPDIRLFASGELPMTGARTTLRVAATPSGSVGFRQRQSHLVVNVEHCLVAHPSLNALLPTTHLEGAQEAVLRVGVSSAERLAWSEPADSLSGLPVDVRLGPLAIVHEVVAGHIFQISASSFFQSSP
ncbi:MAG: TRAM domain-containing protein, partial [Ilumatobacteraceae bacterium]|nr:TRAM domain-containing protein [Ilumatobacteraceae bacterium]